MPIGQCALGALRGREHQYVVVRRFVRRRRTHGRRLGLCEEDRTRRTAVCRATLKTFQEQFPLVGFIASFHTILLILQQESPQRKIRTATLSRTCHKSMLVKKKKKLPCDLGQHAKERLRDPHRATRHINRTTSSSHPPARGQEGDHDVVHAGACREPNDAFAPRNLEQGACHGREATAAAARRGTYVRT